MNELTRLPNEVYSITYYEEEDNTITIAQLEMHLQCDNYITSYFCLREGRWYKRLASDGYGMMTLVDELPSDFYVRRHLIKRTREWDRGGELKIMSKQDMSMWTQRLEHMILTYNTNYGLDIPLPSA